MRYAFLATLFLTFWGFYRFQKTEPKIQRVPQQYYSLAQALDQIPKDLRNPDIFNESTAAEYIEELTRKAYRLRTPDIVPQTDEEQKHFRKKAQSLMENLFQTQLILRDKEKEFFDSGKLSNALVEQFRKAFTYLRYAQDYVVEEWDHFSPLKNESKLFSGAYPLTLVNPQFGELQYQAGDLILVRGFTFASASIARVTDSPSNMSHLAMIGENEKGELFVIESLFQKGVLKYPLEDFLKLERLPRAAIYRYHDPAVAKKAGREAYKIIEKSEKSGKPILFDITMDPDNQKQMYCACLARVAFLNATAGKVQIPKYWSTFDRHQKSGPFLKGLGVSSPKTFAPVDIDTDPQFTLVAEHRDLNLLRTSRMYDVVLSALYRKIEGDYTYKNDAASYVKATGAKWARQAGGHDWGLLAEDFPKHAPIKTIQTLMQQKAITEEVMAVLKLRIELQKARNLSYIEMSEIVDQELEDNKNNYFKPRRKSAPICHKLFL